MHVLNARRKGRALPIGIPLSVKESFLKEESRPTLYTRPIKGSSSNLTFKNVKELERELEELTNDVELLNEEKFNLQKTLKDLETTQMELQQVTEFKKKQVKVFKLELSKFNNENFKNSDSASPQFKNLLNSLLSERQILEKKKMELKRNLESVNREIESV
ncbi:hypothetical protein HK099_008457 [Clydaea vesicula]|uniref:Uncharacterized protein n=1 Tax=Clydaea vesicula TaxID=447962 RepID=A0AAD5XXR9_9FUNG|nr:hypothetical protein HK099_008457 [Clydaea vesicula]